LRDVDVGEFAIVVLNKRHFPGGGKYNCGETANRREGSASESRVGE
jgi:hypothetical protein